MTFSSATILLLLVIDPFGGVPLFLAALKNVDEKKRAWVILRECLFALIILLVFLYFGEGLLKLLHLSRTSLGIAGGIVLFVIALRMIFPSPHGIFGDMPEGEPFVVPLAIPLIAGPSAMATVLLMVSRWPEQRLEWVLALCTAVAISALVLACSQGISRVMGRRGLAAVERLTGLILTAVAVEMLLDGVKEFVQHL